MKNKTFYFITAAAVFASILFWGYMFRDSSVTTNSHQEYATQNEEIILTMYHGEGCMCCVRRAEYLEENGVTVIDELVSDLHKIKREKGVPGQLSSCHTAIVDGYC